MPLPNLYQAIASLPVVLDVFDCGQKSFGRWRTIDKRARFMARGGENIGIAQDVGDLQRRQARLLRPEELARPAQLQVHLRDGESILRINQRPDALLRRIVELLRYQHAVALLGSAPHPSAKLMQL